VKARPPVLLLAAVALSVAVGSLWPRSAPPPAIQPTTEQPSPRTAPLQPATASRLIISDVAVRDVDGRVAWRGDVDLAPVLARIETGVRDPHRNDGGVFGNREGRLPEQRRGYYREYVVRTPGITHAGPQRLIVGAGGELYYTSDHYTTFHEIRP
jgi:ribonuclease T1